MKLEKKMESEIKEIYDAFWKNLFSVNIKEMNILLDDDFRQIGTTEAEVFFNKEEVLKFLKITEEQTVGNIELKNQNVRLEALGEHVLITDLCDVYVKIDNEWTFYAKGRSTFLLHKTSDGWKFILQHTSLPDHRTEEGETVGLKKIEKENFELRDAVKRRTVELENKNRELEKAMMDLKSTQTQLIQSEKMASLGELTAGIAHEIQNPLNFVNNFSEVNKELLLEMKDEIDKANLQEVKSIANDVIDNEEKINHHGKRADAIVKGMLQHSRSSSGVKEPTDINALCDEYLRLSYHGLRAKDKSFNANFKTDFDESIEKINIIPQDIGRVILNLLTNAFYAVNEKKKQQPEGYEPTVSVSTKKVSDKVEVKVEDNGNGIPQKVLDKIFQPFFTTKPTGQGTGLGLSLSYDIIKAHGGELKVETKVGEGAEFIIHLPVKENL